MLAILQTSTQWSPEELPVVVVSGLVSAVGARLRDSLDSSAIRNIDEITLQAGGSIRQVTTPVVWQPIQFQ
jgi:hypothetical protein